MGTDQFTGILRAVIPAAVAFVAGKVGCWPRQPAMSAPASSTILAAICPWKTNTPGKTIN